MDKNTYRVDVEEVFHYRLTVSASSLEDAKAKLTDRDADKSDLLKAEFRVGEFREVAQ